MAMLRRLGRLAGVLLDDQLARGRARESSDMTRQRQEEVYKQGLLDKMAANLGPMLQKRQVKMENIEGLDSFPPELQQTLRTYASGAPSDEEVSAGVLGGVNKDISAAKTPEELGSLPGRFEQARTGMHAQNTAIGLNDVRNLAGSFNAQADVLGNSAATKQEQAVADKQKDFDITHPERPLVTTTYDLKGNPTGLQVFDKPSGKWRTATQTDDLSNAQYQEGRPMWNNGEPQGTQPLDQTRLEQQYRNTLLRALSSRSGGLGLEDQKVNQAIHLKAIFDQNYNPKTGEYNIPSVMTKEIAMGLARLISPTGQVGIELMKEFVQPTVSGDLAKAATYLTGKPTVGNTQEVLRMFKDSIDRQAEVAESNREGYLDAMRQWAPTDLEEGRRKQLEGGLLRLNHYTTQENVEQGHDIPANGVESIMARPPRR